MSKHKHGESHSDGVPAEPEVPDVVGFKKGAKVWVHTADGGALPAIFVGDADQATFFGGPPMVYVVTEGNDEAAQVELDRITARE